MPSTEVSADIGVLDMMVETGLAASKGEARRLISGGGLSLDGNKVVDPMLVISADMFNDGEIIVKKGKKIFHKIIMK